jgi:hypothetical protein
MYPQDDKEERETLLHHTQTSQSYGVVPPANDPGVVEYNLPWYKRLVERIKSLFGSSSSDDGMCHNDKSLRMMMVRFLPI